MEIDEFLDKLEAVNGVEWMVSTQYDAGVIRGYKGKTCLCPITAVAETITGDPYDINEAWEAARDMGLDDAYANLIIGAADCKLKNDPPTQLMRKLLEQVLFNESE